MTVATAAAKVLPGAEIGRFRRVVTGHDANGQSIIISELYVSPPHRDFATSSRETTSRLT